MRYIGGHIHMGLHGFPEFKIGTGRNQRDVASNKEYPDGWTTVTAAAYTLMYDAFVGVPMVAILGHINDYGEEVRRTYYGQAGSHRVKDYGVEYRVLSGALMMSPFLLGWALGAIRHVGKFGMNKFKPPLTQYGGPSGGEAALNTPELVSEEVERWFLPRTAIALKQVQAIIDTHDVEAAREYVTKHRTKIYNMKFVDVMMKADMADIGLPTNITDAWQLNSLIINHAYPGVETLMRRGSDAIKPEQFKATKFIEKAGWSYDY